MPALFWLFCILVSNVSAVDNNLVLTAITQSNCNASTILLDTIFPNFLYKKASNNYFVNVIPAGGMHLDEKLNRVVCNGGSDQCFRNRLQYCAIREYSFELSNQFVRCVQSRKGNDTYILKVCKRFGALEYIAIENCMKDDEIDKEMISLRSRYLPSPLTHIPCLLINDQEISLDQIEQNPQRVFNLLQKRICALPGNKELMAKVCGNDYWVSLQSMYIQIAEQNDRIATDGKLRDIKYNETPFTYVTLHNFASAIRHKSVYLSLIINVISVDIRQLQQQLYFLDDSSFSPFLHLQVIPIVDESKLGPSCDDRECMIQKAILCGTEMTENVYAITRYILCLLSNTAEPIVDVIKRCAAIEHMFSPVILFCMKTEEPVNLLHNVTQWLTDALTPLAYDNVLEAMAADENEMEIEVNGDNTEQKDDGEMGREKDVHIVNTMEKKDLYNENNVQQNDNDMERELIENEVNRIILSLPSFVAIINNKQIVNIDKISLFDSICHATDDHHPLPCRESVDRISIDIYENILCDSNSDSLNDVIKWITQDKKLISYVRIVIHPLVDMLIDKNENEIVELRTPSNQRHICYAITAACAVHLYSHDTAYWPFLMCLEIYHDDAAKHVMECADEMGIEVDELAHCLEDDSFLDILWHERLDERDQQLMVTVSPYVMVKKQRIYRIEELPTFICDILGTERPDSCDHIPQFTAGRSICMIKVFH